MLFPLRDENYSETAPVITILLIGINVTVSLFVWSGGALDSMIQKFGFTPTLALHYPEVLITSIFLHANFLHLLSNMWFLWIYGDNIEDKFGRIPYIALYLGSGIAGNLAHALFTGLAMDMPVIGASGAVAGIMGSYLVCYPTAKIKTLFLLVFYPIIFALPAGIILGGWMVWEFYSAIVAGAGDPVAHWAHVGGFIVGIAWGWGRRHSLHHARGWWW
jgi:membrane associated rhomboid family serine protease